MIKILEVKIVGCVRRDAWCDDVVSFNTVCRCCLDGVVYWLELVAGDVWTVWYIGWN